MHKISLRPSSTVLIVARVATCAVLAGALLTPLLSSAADEAAGQQVFAQCTACHSTDGTNGTGPTLKGVVGRDSATVPGFAYSGAMKRAKLHWTPDELDKYVANPQAIVPGNTMPYAGMPDATQRSALIAYLSTLK
ncbi:MAG TPA: c-type cytochrome [Steroidobacteraceae bacterium]|nr:c-type cytochrome [Steroidobacteraceae bacterium]